MSDDPRDGFPTGPEPAPLWPRLRRLRSGTVAAVRLRPEPRPRGVLSRAWRADPPNSRLLAADAHRPHPGANAWPDDAVLLTYSELRRLVALHLELSAQGMPNTRPWGWIKDRARAVRDGEAPLLLSEVMES